LAYLQLYKSFSVIYDTGRSRIAYLLTYLLNFVQQVVDVTSQFVYVITSFS